MSAQCNHNTIQEATMYVYNENYSIQENIDDLIFLQGALEAAGEHGELTPGLEAQITTLEDHIAAGDALDDKITRARRDTRKTGARVKRTDRVQEGTVRALWSDSLSASKQNKNDLRVKTLFEGGISKLLRPALDAQTDLVEGMVRTLETQSVYEGALRDEHAPKLRDSVDHARSLLEQRAQGASQLAALYADALAWKKEANRLRMAIGAQLIEQGAALELPSPKEFARSFFGKE
jgi:hypothetical protein